LEKKRALEQTEMMSQVKEKLESENHKQQNHIIEKEDMIRNLTKELRNQEKKMYDIQSMFNGGVGVSNSLNMSGMMGGLGPMGD
jgi:predicted RNase H-like nuclease (RuvC/YqgF family)